MMIPESAMEELRTSLRGQLILPGQTGYEEARKVHNAMIDRCPAMIVRCAGVADVIASVTFARTHGIVVAVRGAGHNVAGISLCDGGMVIDLSAMKGIRIDPGTRTVRVEPGVTWAELAHDLQAFGLAATGGFVGTTGVAGLTVGGGLGWMVRKHGLALDNLLSADIVTADGQLLMTSTNEHQDLFWGVRGGGGNFGIVTSFEFKVHPAGTVLAGLVLHPASKGRDALRFWREYESTAPEEMTNGALVFTAPPELPVPDELRREPIVGMGGVYVGPLETGARKLRSLREFGPPAADTYRAMPYSAAQTMADFLWPRGSYNYWKSSYLKAFSDGAIDTILNFYSKAPSQRSVVVVEHNGDGAMSRIPEDATAFGHRDWPYNFLITAVWTNAADTDANIRWTREFWAAMEPFLAGAAYVNYLGEVEEEGVRAAYGSKYERLAALKDKYDATNFFHMNQNIRPSREAVGHAKSGEPLRD
ncbi:MAG TPA: FAD-binding oxidoreductase [Bryobacteraceae bacterium]|nr:FAD-binding oxidoreductase [Bryobacteraceae bacterium]